MATEKKFFVPKVKDDIQAQEVWKSVKKFAEKTLDWEVSERRIFSIAYQKRGKTHYVEVGKPAPLNGEPVIAILESITYLVCTPNRGVLRGMPILIGESELAEIIDFTAN